MGQVCAFDMDQDGGHGQALQTVRGAEGVGAVDLQEPVHDHPKKQAGRGI